ncbi:MAG: aspartate kinase [Planctomycetota bacterium]
MDRPVVCKFGGTSLADAAQFRKVREIVLSDPARRVVVPSAPGRRTKDDDKVTDLLYRCHALAAAGEDYAGVFAEVSQRFQGIADELGLTLDLAPVLEEADHQIGRVAVDGGSAEYAASRGEAINGRLVAELLGAEYVDAVEVMRFGGDGRFDAAASYASVAERLDLSEAGKRYVVPGFYGSDAEGGVRTFSRGGSDVTGAVVARGLGASVYENWTDVPGLLITDPRVVPEAFPIEVMTYRELRELSYSGATVLHEDAVFPVREAGVPVVIKSTNAPEQPGTRIVSRHDREADPDAAGGYAITGIAGRKDFTVITLEKAMMNSEVGFGRRALSVLEDMGISFEHMPSGIDTMSVVVADDALEGGRLERVKAKLREELGLGEDEVSHDGDIALIATVGRGMSRRPGMAAKLFAALASADGGRGVNIRVIDQGSSELNIIVGVATGDYEAAVRAIYDAFVTGAGKGS